MTEKNKQDDLRAEIRKAASEWASVEFRPEGVPVDYHFKLRDISPSGIGVLVKKDSDIFKFIAIGDTMPMKYHKGDATPFPQLLNVEIRHISEPTNGKHQGHMVIGFLILETIETYPEH